LSYGLFFNYPDVGLSANINARKYIDSYKENLGDYPTSDPPYSYDPPYITISTNTLSIFLVQKELINFNDKR
jgi:hypothetical protein